MLKHIQPYPKYSHLPKQFKSRIPQHNPTYHRSPLHIPNNSYMSQHKTAYKEEQGYNRRTMCSFTNFSSNKTVKFFGKQPKSWYESYLSRHTSESLKNIVKILETRPQSSKNAQKWTKICKIHDVDKITLLFGFQKLFCVLFWSLAQKT